MKIVRMVKDAVLAPFMVMLIPRTLRRMDDLFRSTHELFRRSDELFSKTDELFRRGEDLSRGNEDILRRIQATEDWLRGEGMAQVNAHVQDAQTASLAAQGMVKSLEANLRDLAQLRAELQRRTGK